MPRKTAGCVGGGKQEGSSIQGQWESTTQIQFAAYVCMYAWQGHCKSVVNAMDCHSDFFSLLSLSQVNNTATSSALAPAAASLFSAPPPAAGIAPSLNQLGLSYSNGHRLKNGGGVSDMSTAASAHSLGLGGPVLVASQCSVNDIDMTDGSMSTCEGANGLSSMACRQFSGIKRKRDNAAAQQLALVGDDAEVRGSAEWATTMPNGYSHLQVDLDLQPEKQKVRVKKKTPFG